MEQKQYAVALGSGGQKGLIHIGVLKALEQLNIEITHISGSSIGALIGAVYAIWKDAKKLEEFALKIDDDELKEIISSYANSRSTKKDDPVLFFIQKYVNDATFQDCLIPYVTVSVDLNSGEKIFHTEGPLKHAIRGSCSVPYLFGAYEYENKFLIDGGFVDSVPVDAAKSIGAEKVIGVNLQSYIPDAPQKRSYINIQASTYKTMLYNIAKEDMKLADEKLEFNIGDFSINEILEDKERFIDIGYQKTIRLFENT